MSQLITVGMPVFNGMPYLPEALESLLSQTCQDFNILVINDGSTDGTAEYLRTIQDSRLQVVTQTNVGITATLNRMLEIAQTQWLVRHDADDIAYPRRLEQTLEYIHKYPTAGMFYSEADYYPIKRGVAKFRTTKGDPKELYAITKAGYLLAICHPSVTLNIEKTRAVGGYRFNLYVEDIDLWWRMALAYDIRFIPEVTVGVRQNQASSSWQNLEQQAVNALYVQYLLLAALSNLGPHSYDEIYPLLYSFLDRRKFRLKKHLRDANIHLTETHYAKGLLYLSQAFFCSPSAFLQRIHYGLFPRPNVSNGEDPLLLAKKCGELWPEYAKLSLFRGNVQDDRSKCW